MTEYTVMIKLVMGLVVVGLSMWIVFVLLKKVKQKHYFNNKMITILGGIHLGQKEKVILIQIKRKKILVGVTPNTIQNLYVYEDRDFREELK